LVSEICDLADEPSRSRAAQSDVKQRRRKKALERLHREGWRLGRQRGSHRQFVHPAHPGRRVTVAGHPHLDIPKGTLNSIFKQAGWK